VTRAGRGERGDGPAALEAAAGVTDAAAAAAEVTLSPEQAALNRVLLVLNFTVCAGYWAEVDACVGACRDFSTDTAKDGLLYLTMRYAAVDAAKAAVAYTGPRRVSPMSGGYEGPPQWTWTRRCSSR
jgi:hypothetical protein